MATDVIMEEDIPSSSTMPAQDSGIMDDMDRSPCDPDEGYPPSAPPLPSNQPTNASIIPIRPSIDNRANRPQRKIGLFLCGQEKNNVSLFLTIFFFNTTCFADSDNHSITIFN